MRKEVKQLVIEKKLVMWNNIVEKANQDFEGNKKQFWSFVGRRTKCKNKTISSLKSESGISVSSTKGKLQILQQHYQLLGTSMVDSAFDGEWKLEVEEKVLEYSKQNLKDLDLDKEIEESIGVNRTDLGGTVPLLGYSSRCPALHLICHALCSDTLISRIYRVKYAYSGSMHGLSM